MREALYIVLGWTLALLSPFVINRIRARSLRRTFCKAVSSELRNLKYRLAITRFILLRRQGKLDVQYLRWLRPILDSHPGSDPDDIQSNQAIKDLVDHHLEMDPAECEARLNNDTTLENVSHSLKTYVTSYLDSNIDEISNLSSDLQEDFHELRSRLSILNQEISRVMELHTKTFDSSISDDNQEILVSDIKRRHGDIQDMMRRVVDMIDVIEKRIDVPQTSFNRKRFAIPFVAVVAVVAVAVLFYVDWRDEIEWLDLVSAECTERINSYCVMGESPFCIVSRDVLIPINEPLICNWLSEDHCLISHTGDRTTICVPNPAFR